MTQASTTSPGVLGQRGSRKLGTAIGAVLVVIAAGAAIATGINRTSDVAQPIGNHFTQAHPRVERPENTVGDWSYPTNIDDLIESGHVPAGSGGTSATEWSYPTNMDELIKSGMVPAGALGNLVTAPTTWSYPTDMDELIRDGFVPGGETPALVSNQTPGNPF